MIRYWVELSRENLPLASAELEGAAAAVGGGLVAPAGELPGRPTFRALELPGPSSATALAARLALARRVLAPVDVGTDAEAEAYFRREGASGRSIVLRPLGRPGAEIAGEGLERLARAYVAGGGRVDLEHPERRVYATREDDGRWRVAEEISAVDRQAFARRRMPMLPFRRPVSLPPKLGRVAVNLAAVRPGDRVVDPFVGTGALLLEAALIGAHVSGVDRDPEMVKGAVRNFTHLALEFDRLTVGDAAEATGRADGAAFDAVVTDPPYGRSSGSGGEPPTELVQRVLPRWAALVRPGGRVVVVLPGGPDPLERPWRMTVRVADRVHRSLTREFRVYERDPAQ